MFRPRLSIDISIILLPLLFPVLLQAQTAACCTREGCVNLTEKQCAVERGLFRPCLTCDTPGYECPPFACINGEGSCFEERQKTCVGGAHYGEACDADSECRGFCGSAICFGGPPPTPPCSNNADCGGFVCRRTCQGGPFPNAPCQIDDQCNRDAVCVFIDNGTRHCVGGANDGAVCTNHPQCPGGGVCSYHVCVDNDGPIDSPMHGKPCREQRDCWEAKCEGEPGCGSLEACAYVCHQERVRYGSSYCCDYHWDEYCGDSFPCPFHCGEGGGFQFPCCPENDDCPNARELGFGGAVTVHTASAGTESDDPEFCCNTAPVGAPALGTRWYHFVATHTSARLSTCGSVEPEEPDSLLQVFEARNARSPELACATLTPIGCSDDSDRCSPDTGNADLCLGNLKIGRTYYVLVAAKTECARGNYTLTLTAPCSPADRTCPREGPRRNNRR